MAVAVAEAQVTVKAKESISNSRSIYTGTIAFGTEYATGGDTVANAEGQRFNLPTGIDTMLIAGSKGWDFEYLNGKIVAYGGAAGAKGVGVEAASKQDLSAVTAAAFIAIGIS